VPDALLVDEPAEPAVLPAEPDGVEPAVEPDVVPPDALPVVEPIVDDLSLMVLVLTSQHLLGSTVLEPVPVPCALAKPMPAIVAAAAMIAIFFMGAFPMIDIVGGIADPR
jgi:hypothetical protein